jgi:N-acetylglucosamine-6-sulfatase
MIALAILFSWMGQIMSAEAASSSQPGPGEPSRAASQPVVANPPKPARPAKQPDADWVKQHGEFSAEAKKGGIDLLFVGDSITRGWRGAKDVWEKNFGSYKTANFGIGGDRTEHVLYRLSNGELDGIAPKVVVLLIGTNNIDCKNSPEDSAEGVKAILATIKAKSPGSVVLLLGALPRGADPQGDTRVNIPKLNELTAKFDDRGKTVRFLDLTSKFMDGDGLLKEAYNDDHTHLTHKGYEIMGDAIGPVVKAMMAPPAKSR